MDKNILIVEDDIAIREGLFGVLTQEGFKVTLAANGEEGLKLLLTNPNFRLIILDLMMPVMDGFEFLAAKMMNETISQIPVVVISAFVDKIATIKDQDILKKPIALQELLSLIRKYCQSPVETK